MSTTVRIKDAVSNQSVDVLVDQITHIDGVPVSTVSGATTADGQIIKLVHGVAGQANFVSGQTPLPAHTLASAFAVDRPVGGIGTIGAQVLAAIAVGDAPVRETFIANHDAVAVIGVRHGDSVGLTLATADFLMWPGDSYSDEEWAGAWSIVSSTANPDVRITRKRTS